MEFASTACAKCQTNNPALAKYCSECGAPLTVTGEVGNLSRKVLDKVEDQALDHGVKWLFDKAAGFAVALFTALLSVLTSVFLAIIDGAMSAGEWFLLTWPLTIAVSILFILFAGPLKGSTGIAYVTVTAGVLVVAMALGTSVAGQKIEMADEAGGFLPIRLAINALLGFEHAYGPVSFFLSLATGGFVGALYVEAKKSL